MKSLLLGFISLLVLAPVSAQVETWCQFWDFTQSQGWNLSYGTGETYGRWAAGAGFAASDYGSLDYVTGRSIRIDKDFTGTLTQLVLVTVNSNYDIFRIDFDSRIEGGGFEESLVLPVEGDPLIFDYPGVSVSGRLGIEILTNTFLGTDDPLNAVITGIQLSGTGTDPFSGSNCAEGQLPTEATLTLPVDEIYTALGEANAAINALPDDLTAPLGIPILPNANAPMIFGYVKWLLSAAAADEYAGPFAPIYTAFGVGLTAMFSLLVVYVGAWILVMAVRLALWVFRWVLRLIDLVLQAIQAGADILLRGAKAVLSFLGG